MKVILRPRLAVSVTEEYVLENLGTWLIEKEMENVKRVVLDHTRRY